MLKVKTFLRVKTICSKKKIFLFFFRKMSEKIFILHFLNFNFFYFPKKLVKKIFFS